MADKKISQLTAASTPLAGTEVLPIVQSSATVKVSVADLTAGRSVSANGLTSTANVRVQYSAAGNASVVANNTASTAGATSQIIATNDAARNLRIQYTSSGGAGGAALTNGITTETGQIYTDGNYPLVLGTNVSAAAIIDTSQNVKLINNLVQGTAAKGVNFTANTPAANMTSQLLNWYEEGAWTPSLGGTATYNAQTGTYTRIGRLVVVHFVVDVNVLGTGSGSAISGLPFTSFATNRGAGGVAYVASPASAFTSISPFVGVGASSVQFVCADTAGAWTNAATVFQSGTVIAGTVSYFV